MRQRFALGLVGLVVALACDDAHKVGDDIGAGGRGSATGGKGGKGGGASTGAAGSVGIGGSLTNGGAVGNGGAIATSGGSPIVGGGGAGGNGGAMATSGGSPIVGNGGASGNGGAIAPIGGTSTSNGTGGAGGASSTGTGGTPHAGGTVGIGGTTGAAGAAGGPSILDETCTWPSVQFEFTVDDPSLYCYHPDFVIPNYSLGGIRILTPDGHAVTNLGAKSNIGQWTCDWPRCTACPDRCGVAYDPSRQEQVTSAPRTGTWDGGFDIASTCGNFSNTCYANRCVQPGKFIAKYCVAPKGLWSTCNVGDPRYFFDATACVEVPFDFPTTEVVRGKITQAISTAGAAGAAGDGGAGVAGNGGAAGRSL